MAKIKPVEIKLLNKLKTKCIFEEKDTGKLIWEGKEQTPVMCTTNKQLERLTKRNLIKKIDHESMYIWRANTKLLIEIGVF